MKSSLQLVRSLFRHHRTTRTMRLRRSRQRLARSLSLSREQLEARLALAVGWIPSTNPGGWHVIYSTEGSDIYVQQIATNPQNLIIADNSSFNNYLTIPDINGSNARPISVVQGAFTQALDLQRTGIGSELTTRHLLRRGSVLNNTFTNGQITYGGNLWSFSSANLDSNGAMLALPSPTSTSASPTGRPLTVRLVDAGEENRPGITSTNDIRVGRNATLEVLWDSPPLNTATLAPEIQVTYRWAGAGSGAGQHTDTSLASASSGRSYNTASFQLPLGTQSLGILPSTFTGSFTVQDPGTFPRTMYFRASNATSTTGSLFTLDFDDIQPFSSNNPIFTLSQEVADNIFATDPPRFREVTGTLDATTGQVTLSFFTRNDVREPVDPGQVRLSATYLVPERTANPISFTLAPGQTFSRPLSVDLATPNSTVNFNSAATLSGPIAISATNINFNSPFTANGRMDIGPSPTGREWGRTAQALAHVAGEAVTEISVPHGLGGIGYRTPPTVTIAPPTSGTRATATAVVEAGRVVGITITDPGSGYTAIPTVSLGPPEGLQEFVFTVPAAGVTLTLPGDVLTSIPVGRDIELRSSLVPNGPWARRTVIDAQKVITPATATITAATRIGNVNTYTLNQSSTLSPGELVRVTGLGDPSFDIEGEVTSVSGLNFTVARDGLDASVTSGNQGTLSTVTTSVTLSSAIDLNTTSGRLAVYTILPPTVPESVTFNSTVLASTYDIRVADDQNTTGRRRGRMFVSGTGSLQGSNFVYVQADTADIVVEGRVDAAAQSYLMRSPLANSDRAPFLFTTRSPVTNADTGRLVGADLAITLGNEVLTPDRNGSLANKIAITTQVDSLRVTAAAASTTATAYPFDLSVTEEGSIAIDAVAASSGSISLQAATNLALRSSLVTDGDVSIAVTGGAFDVSAPIQTTRGSISVEALSINVANSIRVLDAPSDALRDDIVLTATDGSLTLDGQLSAVNGVRLTQDHILPTSPGVIGGATRIISRTASVRADGNVSIRTAVDSLTVQTRGNVVIDELDDITIPLLRANLAAIEAGGYDPGLDSPFSPNAIALSVAMQGVNGFSVSAPRGSIDVNANTTGSASVVQLGTSGGATSAMRAAGSVAIRTTGGSIDVFDAPTGGGGSAAARVVAKDPLRGDFSLENPGFVSSTITGSVPGPLVVDGVALRPRDIVLVANGLEVKRYGTTTENNEVVMLSPGGTDKLVPGMEAVGVGIPSGRRVVGVDPQANTVTLSSGLGVLASANLEITFVDPATQRANGLYTVTSAGSAGQPWVLTRAAEYDVSRELPNNAFVRILEGTSAGIVYALEYDSRFGSSPLSATQVANIGSSERVRVATTLPLPGTYNGSSIEALSNGDVLPLIDGVAVEAGDLILVRLGTTSDGAETNGVYEVTSTGGASAKWRLMRASSPTTGLPIELGLVTVDEGTFRTSQTGNAFLLQFDSLGHDPLLVRQTAAAERRTNIGTDDINGKVQLIVSSVAGTNDAAGSLGRMISIQERNDIITTPNPGQKSDLLFASTLSNPNDPSAEWVTIELTQQLPNIARAYAIDGSLRVIPYSLHRTQADSNLLVVDSVQGIQVGMMVVGPGLLPGTLVAAIDASTNGITLSRAASNSAPLRPGLGTFTFAARTASITGTASALTITPTQVNGTINVGDLVFGPGLPDGATVQSVQIVLNNTVVTLSRSAASAPANSTWSFFPSTPGNALTRPSGLAGTRPIVISGQNISKTNVGGGTFRQSGGAEVQRDNTPLQGRLNQLKLSPSFRDFDAVGTGMIVSGNGIRPGTRVDDIDRTNRTITLDAETTADEGTQLTVTIATDISGFVYSAGSGGARLAGLYIGGFDAGAAIQLGYLDSGASGAVTIQDIDIGRTPGGGRLGNLFGIRVEGGDQETGQNGDTEVEIFNTRVMNSFGAGVRTVARADVHIAASDIGDTSGANSIGIDLSGTGSVRIGDTFGQSFRARAIRVDDVRDLVAPTGGNPGAELTGNGVPASTRIARIFEDGTGNGGVVYLTNAIDFVDGQILGFEGSNSSDRRASTRVVVSGNQRGIDMRNGDVVIENTTITGSTFDGLRINKADAGTPPAAYRIGNLSGGRDGRSNLIVGNGVFGVRFVEPESRPRNPEDPNSRTWIRGNDFVVVDSSGSVISQNGRGAVGYQELQTGDLAAPLLSAAFGFKPRSSGVDRWGNFHAAAPAEPTMYVALPFDNSSIDSEANKDDIVVVRGSNTRNIRSIDLVLEDDRNDILAGSVTPAAFTVKYSASRSGDAETFNWNSAETLVAGRDYALTYNPLLSRVSIQPIPTSALFRDGSYLIDVDNSDTGVTDADGNLLRANGVTGSQTKTAFVVVLDSGPQISISSSAAALAAGQTSTIGFALTSSSTDFTREDVTVVGGTLSNFVGSGTAYTATFTPFPNSTVSGMISVADDRFTSNGIGNLAGALTTPIAINTVTRPGVLIASDRAVVRRGETATVSFTLSEISTDFGIDDVTVSGGQLTNFGGSGVAYSATFTPLANSTAPGMISVEADRFTSPFGQPNRRGELTPPIIVNTAAQTALISVAPGTLRAGQTAEVTFLLNEPSSDFTVDDVTVSGGRLVGFTGSDAFYSATFEPLAGATAGMISVASGRFTDPDGNANVGSALLVPIVIDTIRPTITITSSMASLRAGQTATITFALSEPATNFTAFDVVATGGTLSGFSGSGATYSATFTPTVGISSQGTISVVSGAFTDAYGNPSVAGVLTPPISIDTVTPTLTITSSSAALRAGQTATLTFTLSETASNFGVGAVVVGGGTLSNFNGSGTTYTATFTPASNSTVAGTASVPAGAFTDTAGNGNAATALSPDIVIDTARPAVVSVLSDVAILRIGETATISFTLSESTSNFTLDDIVVSGGTLSHFAGSGARFTAIFTPAVSSTTLGSVTIADGAFTDAAGNGNIGATLALPIAIDTVAPVVIGFSTTSTNRTYGIGESVVLVATLSEAVRAGGMMQVTLNTGATVSLTADGSTTAVGTYMIEAGQAAEKLDVVAIVPSGTTLVDLAGNPLTGTSLPPAADGLAARHAIRVDAVLRVLPIANLSNDPAVVPAVRQPVVRVPITFSTPVTGVTTAAFRLLLNGRSVSLRGATVTGSGTTYTLTLPPRRTTARGIYTLQVLGDAGISSVINGVQMTTSQFFYWGRGRSVGSLSSPRLAAFASFR